MFRTPDVNMVAAGMRCCNLKRAPPKNFKLHSVVHHLLSSQDNGVSLERPCLNKKTGIKMILKLDPVGSTVRYEMMCTGSV